MDPASVKLIATGLTIAIGVIGPALSIGKIGAKALEAVGRNPESASKIQPLMMLAIVFTESIAIFALVVAIIIKFV
jgi:F-type H+-transporting ATPase subunit c